MFNKVVNIFAIYLCFALFFIMPVSLPIVANAVGEIETNTIMDLSNTDVLADLQYDSNFNILDYLEDADDYSLNIIQVSENLNSLLVYVYQPCANEELKATSLNLSKGFTEILFNNYTLSYINSNGPFFKYKVDNLVVASGGYRAYEISSIYRAFNSDYDAQLQNGNDITYISYPVGRRWVFKTENSQSVLDYTTDTEIIEITDKFVGYVRYLTNHTAFVGDYYHDVSFVAFSTDKTIDKLLSADVYYQEKLFNLDSNYHRKPTNSITYNRVATVNYDTRQIVSENHAGFLRQSFSYNWTEIESVPQFIANVNATNPAVYYMGLIENSVDIQLNNNIAYELQNYDWVLNFNYTNTDHYVYPNSGGHYGLQYLTTNVSILRLEFETDGVYYNIGAVDDMQSGDDEPANTIETHWGLTDNVKQVLGKIGVFLKKLGWLILIVILAPFILYILKALGFILKGICNFFVALFSEPEDPDFENKSCQCKYEKYRKKNNIKNNKNRKR